MMSFISIVYLRFPEIPVFFGSTCLPKVITFVQDYQQRLKISMLKDDWVQTEGRKIHEGHSNSYVEINRNSHGKKKYQ